MKRLITNRIAGVLVAGALLALGSVAANAAETAAGTSITNKATVNYSVGGVGQTAIESSPTGNATPGVGNGTATAFLVDDKVVISVTNSDAADSTTGTQPGSTKAVLTFSVENDGNAAQDVYLTAVNMAASTADPNGGTSNLAITTSGVYSDSGCTTSITKLTNLGLGAGNAKTVYVCSTIPTTATGGEIAVVGLQTQVGAANGSGIYKENGTSYSDDSTVAWDGTKTQIIFAEPASATPTTGDTGAYDGYSSDLGAFKVVSANLTITKTATVLTDPINCTTAGVTTSCTAGAKLHAIPGAWMRYTVTIANSSAAGTQTATGVAVTDNLGTAITAGMAWESKLTVTTPGVNSGSSFTCADTGTTKTADAATPQVYTDVTCGFSSNTVSVSGITLQAGDTATITYDALIN